MTEQSATVAAPTVQDAPAGWRLTAGELAATREKVARLNARAARTGLTGELRVEATREVHTIEGIEEIYWRTQILGTSPSLDGWTFLAAVDTVPGENGDAFVLRTPPGVDASSIDRSRLVAGACEHCGTSRSRLYTYLVTHEDGRTLQVGRSCLQDFLGLKALPSFFFDTPSQDDFTGGIPTRPGVSVRTALALTYAATTLYGWVPRSGYSDSPATADTVSYALFPTTAADRALRAELEPLMEDGYTCADMVITDLPPRLAAEESGYAANLTALLSAPEVSPKHLGLLCSALRAQERLANTAAAERERPEQVDAWQGQVGEQLTVDATIVVAARIDGFAYNTTSNLIVAETPGGAVKMISAAAWAYEVEVGQQLRLSAKVKAHTTYGETKQTVLTRPKVLEHL